MCIYFFLVIFIIKCTNIFKTLPRELYFHPVSCYGHQRCPNIPILKAKNETCHVPFFNYYFESNSRELQCKKILNYKSRYASIAMFFPNFVIWHSGQIKGHPADLVWASLLYTNRKYVYQWVARFKGGIKCFVTFEDVHLFCFHRIIQQLVNGIIAPTAMPNMGMGPWWVANEMFCLYVISQCMINHSWSLDSKLLSYRGVLHSNPMDYAWGANGLDAIITQVSSGLLLCFITTRNMKFYRTLCCYRKQYQCI